MHYPMDKIELAQELKKLNVIDRLNIISEIWDEIKDSEELEAVSESEKRLLLNRLANYRANPDSATEWGELRQEVHSEYADKS